MKNMAESFGARHKALDRFYERYCLDPEVRARLARGDLSDLGLPEGIEIRIVEQSADTYYFPLPPEPDAAVSDAALASVAGGSTAAIPGMSLQEQHAASLCMIFPPSGLPPHPR